MVFGESCLILKHVDSGTKIHFNAFDAITGWKQEGLCPVKVPAAAKWNQKPAFYNNMWLSQVIHQWSTRQEVESK
ncbi:hypothetical protein ACJW30_11G187000 [Castanea mollissima]